MGEGVNMPENSCCFCEGADLDIMAENQTPHEQTFCTLLLLGTHCCKRHYEMLRVSAQAFVDGGGERPPLDPIFSDDKSDERLAADEGCRFPSECMVPGAHLVSECHLSQVED